MKNSDRKIACLSIYGDVSKMSQLELIELVQWLADIYQDIRVHQNNYSKCRFRLIRHFNTAKQRQVLRKEVS